MKKNILIEVLIKKFLLITVVLLSFCALFVSCNSDVTSNYQETKEYKGPKVFFTRYAKEIDGVRYYLEFDYVNDSLGYTEENKDRQVALYVWVKDINTNEWPTYPVCYFGYVDKYYYDKVLSETPELLSIQKNTQTLVFDFRKVKQATAVYASGYPYAFENVSDLYASTLNQYDGVVDAGPTQSEYDYEMGYWSYASFTNPFAGCENPSFQDKPNSIFAGIKDWIYHASMSDF